MSQSGDALVSALGHAKVSRRWADAVDAVGRLIDSSCTDEELDASLAAFEGAVRAHGQAISDLSGPYLRRFLDSLVAHELFTQRGETVRTINTLVGRPAVPGGLSGGTADQRGRGESVLRHVRMPRVKENHRRALSDAEMWRLIECSGEGEQGGRDHDSGIGRTTQLGATVRMV